MAAILAAMSLLSSVPAAHGAFCHGKPDPEAKRNTQPIFTDAPVFVRSVQNASLYRVGNDENAISVVHLWGNAYQRGFAHGTLMKEDMTTFLNQAFSYFESQFVEAINGTVPWIPQDMADWVAREGLDVALDITYDAMKPFSGKYFWDEMHGMADATGVDWKLIRRVTLIGELTKGSCSMIGAWGDATVDGKTLQLRALDWDVGGPFQNFPQITVYHSDGPSDGQDFANVGWTGWVGSITGMSSRQTAISEIGVSFPDETFGKESRIGTPFVFLLRDIIQFDNSIEDAKKRITDARRTCDLILGVGDGKVDSGVPFNSVQYGHSVANFINDKNLLPVNDTWHQPMDSIVYHGMDWLCPGYSIVLQNQLKKLRGKLSPEIIVSDVTAIVQTGDLHIAIYDLTDDAMYVSNARSNNETGADLAYDRQFIKFDMKALFATSPQ